MIAKSAFSNNSRTFKEEVIEVEIEQPEQTTEVEAEITEVEIEQPKEISDIEAEATIIQVKYCFSRALRQGLVFQLLLFAPLFACVHAAYNANSMDPDQTAPKGAV